MASDKAAKREERKKAKQEKAQRLVQQFSGDRQPKEIKKINVRESPKIPITPKNRKATLAKLPVFKKKPSIYDSPMTWCTELSDISDCWSWGEDRNWTSDEWKREILRELEPLTQQTWSEIARMETGEGKSKKRRKRHHPQEINSIITEAQKRWKALELEQFDVAYRFRLGGTKRIWGFQCGSHFYLVWYERSHSIYPTS